MRKKGTLHAVVVFFIIISSLGAAKAQPPFLGEQLTAEITFLNIPVATATLQVTQETLEGDQSSYRLAITAKSTRFYSLLYKVDNRYDSFFTWPHFQTLRYERHIREPGVDLQRVVRYQGGQAIADGEEPVSVPGDVRDLFSALYALRGQPLNENQVIDSPMDLDGQLWVVRATVLGRERVKTRLDGHMAIKVMVRFLNPNQAQRHRRESDVLTNNLVKERTKLTIWFSDDEQRIPLKAQYRFSPFFIKAVFSTTN
jgi:hypothetical protein